jgi:hypothetical protein
LEFKKNQLASNILKKNILKWERKLKFEKNNIFLVKRLLRFKNKNSLFLFSIEFPITVKKCFLVFAENSKPKL